jgi:hypothetical protein
MMNANFLHPSQVEMLAKLYLKSKPAEHSNEI